MTVSIRAVTEDDLPFLNRLTNDAESAGAHQWYGWQNPHTWRRRWEDNGMLGDDGGVLLIVEGQERAGFLSFRKQVTSRVAFCWEIGLIVAPEFRGKGNGTRAQELMVRYLFDHSLANRIQATTEVSNAAERRALEKAGFTREGVLRGGGFRAGEWQDGVIYGIVRSDLDGQAAP